MMLSGGLSESGVALSKSTTSTNCEKKFVYNIVVYFIFYQSQLAIPFFFFNIWINQSFKWKKKKKTSVIWHIIIGETTEGGGLAVKSVVPSGLEYEGPRFESHNGKRLRLNPTIPTLNPLVPSWGWDNSYGSPVPSRPSG